MSAEFPELNHLIAALSPTKRRALAKTLNSDLRAQTSKDISKNIDADGNVMVSRKDQRRKRNKKGNLRKRGKMFQKLGQRRAIRMSATASAATLSFQAKNRRIAGVHQWGLRSTVNKFGKRVKYPVRELLGFNPIKQKIVEDGVLKHLGGEK